MAEKGVNELPRDMRVLFTKGNEALQRDNFDYAIDLFNQVLVREPANYECRKALREAQQGKSGGGKGFFKKVLSTASSGSAIAKGELALRKDPAEALQIAEHILNHDANNSAAHRIIVKAATALGMPRTAVMSLEILVRNSPKDVHLVIQFANGLAEAGLVNRAEKILVEFHRLVPGDNDVTQALKDISARKTLEKGGYEALSEGTGSYRDILKDKEEAVMLEQQNRQVHTEDTAARLIAEYEARLKNEPNNLKTLRNLAELYTQKKQFDTALDYFARIKTSDMGADASLDRAIAETRVRKFEYQFSQLDPNSPEYPEKAGQLEAEKQAYQLDEAQKRAERFPMDMGIRFELGQLYFKLGKIAEAIREFQKAQTNLHKKVAAMNYLGQCYAKRKMLDLAARTFESAIKEKLIFDDEKKDLVYNYAGVLEQMSKREDAFKQLQELYAVDSGYKDVEARVNDYLSGQQ